MLSGYQNFATSKSNNPFVNNSMLANNPIFNGSINDPSFHQRIQMAKMDQLRKIKSVDDLNVSHDQLMKYIICPIKAEKLDQAQALTLYSSKQNQYQDTNNQTTPKMLVEWWETRTNMPYKNILKNENYKKTINSKDDLIVYRVSILDKNKTKLMEECAKLEKLLEKHNGELKVIYSASELNKYKQEFEYVQKYKYRIKHDPNDFDGLKKMYKKEQKKLSNETKRISNMIDSLLENEDLTEEELRELKQMQENDDSDVVVDRDDDDMNDDMFEEKLKEKLKKEMSKDEYDAFMNTLEKKTNNGIGEAKNSSQIKPKIKVKTVDKNDKVDKDDEPVKPKRKIIISTKTTDDEINNDKPIGELDDDILNAYKNRKKQN